MNGPYLISIILRARDLASKGIHAVSKSMDKLGKQSIRTNKDVDQTSTVLQKLAKHLDSTSYKLGELNRSFQGLQVALVVKYFQSLLSAAVALGGELVALASSAISAGGAIGGALAAGVAQAIPVFALLAGAMSRVKEVMKAVELQQKITTSAADDNKKKMDDQRGAADRLANAKRSLSDAIRDQRLAQESLNDARKQGIRTLVDMAFAQKRAILDAKNANLAIIDAKAALRRAELTGSAQEIKQARLDVQAAVLDRDESRVDASRSTVDNRRAQQGGVDRLPQVVSSRRQLASANRRVADATRDVARAQAQATETSRSLTSQQQNLNDLLAQLSPAEQRLYRSILNIRSVYKDFRKQTIDSITGAFATAVDRAAKFLQDKRVINAAKGLSDEVGKQLNRLTNFGLGNGGKSFLVTMADEAKRNLKPATDVLLNVFRILRNIAEGASDMFHRLLRDTARWTGQLAKTTFSLKNVKEFFDGDGEKALRAWLKLLGSIINLFAAIIGIATGRGTKSVKELAKTFNGWADDIRNNRGAVKEFFDRAHDGTIQVLRVLKEIAKTMVGLFDEGQIKALADFLIYIMIPALANVIAIMGELTEIFHELLALPVVRDIAQWLVTIFLLIKAFELVKTAFVVFSRTIIGFFLANPITGAIIAIIAALVILDKKFHFLAPTFKFVKKIAKEVWDWLVQAAKDVVDFFKDSWNKGLLKWLRTPFETLMKFYDKIGVFDFIIDAAKASIEILKTIWPPIVDIVLAPFKLGVKLLKPVFELIRTNISSALKFIRGDIRGATEPFRKAFESIGDAISSVWQGILNGIYKGVTATLNFIIDAVNKVIGAFNKLPGPDIGEIKVKFVENRQAALTVKAARAGKSVSNYAGPHAEGGYLKARPGGHMAIVGEDNHDEVILTSDPKHAQRQRRLLSRFMMAAPHLFAEGGYVQGAIPPGAAGTRKFADFLISKGFFVTSAYNGRHSSKGYHFRNGGDAIDLGDSVNNLARLWRFLTPYRRNIAELLGPYGGWHNGVQFYKGVYPDHADHIHIGGYGEKFSSGGGIGGFIKGALSAIAKLPKALVASVRSLLGNEPKGGSFAHAGLVGVHRLAERAIKRIQARAQGTTEPTGTARGADANVVAAFRRAIRRSGASKIEQLALWEAGIVESGLRNLHYGDRDSLGALQERVGIYGRDHALDPFASAMRFLQQARGLRPWRSSAGLLAQAVQRSAFPGRYDQAADQARTYLRGYKTGTNFAARGLALVGEDGPELVEFKGGERVHTSRRSNALLEAMYRASRAIGSADTWAQELIASDAPLKLTRVASRGGKIARLVQRVADTVQNVIDGAGQALLRAQVRIGRSGVTVRDLSDVQQAGIGVQSAADVEQALLSQRSSLLLSLSAQRSLVKNSKGRARERAERDLQKLRAALVDLDDQIRQSALDLVEAQKTLITTKIQRVDDRASAATDAASRRDRLRTALGQSSPIALVNDQIAIATTQLEGLKTQLSEAQRLGFTDVTHDLWARIEDLNVTIAEYGAQQVQNQIDFVNDQAQRSLSVVDRKSRLANLLPTQLRRLDSNADIIGQRGAVLQSQRDGLAALLGSVSGDHAAALRDSIEELDVQIAENTEAQRQNTLQIRQTKIDAITNRSSFGTGVFSGLSGIVGTLGAISGVTNVASQIALAKQSGRQLQIASTDLARTLFKDFGIDLRGLSGQDFVDKLSAIDLNGIEQRLPDDERALFEGLINALISNQGAIAQNTQELQQLNQQQNAQSFASSFWQNFRVALFNGAGGLLPNFASTIPSMAAGGMTLREGLYHLHPGEVVGSAKEFIDRMGGDTYNLNITTPTQVLDPTDVSRQLAFHRKTGGR